MYMYYKYTKETQSQDQQQAISPKGTSSESGVEVDLFTCAPPQSDAIVSGHAIYKVLGDWK
jgi:hypothetical protein